jgi:16S rRNA (cytosine1402-N4)-methyltransferase
MHVPVLLQEVCEGLSPKPNDIVVDATVGMGSHARRLGALLSKEGVLVAIDRDEDALAAARGRLKGLTCRVFFVEENYRNIKEIVARLLFQQIDRLLIDLGMSLHQIQSSGRGFTFLKDEPLLMTFEKNPSDESAKDIVNGFSEEKLADLIYQYGEERFSKRIAKGICAHRKRMPINTTFQLVEAIRGAVPRWYLHGRTHFATKTFQALRIAVNDEVESLREGLRDGIELLSSGGRAAVLTYHSIDDRVVKRMFRDMVRSGGGMLVNIKPIMPSKKERLANPRSRSAKLRIFEKG